MANKTASELDREIAQALGEKGKIWAPEKPAVAKSTMKAVTSSSAKLTSKRAKDFRDSGNYEVRDESGALVALLFRDPESREWYEDSLPGAPQTHYTDRWRGFTQADALATIARRRAG